MSKYYDDNDDLYDDEEKIRMHGGIPLCLITKQII